MDLLSKPWSRKHNKCISCRTTSIPHRAYGYCIRCYDKYYYEKRQRIKRDEKALFKSYRTRGGKEIKKRINRRATLLTKARLYDEYYTNKKSYSDIAAEYGFTRSYVSKKMREFGFRSRPKSESRKLAQIKGKIDREVIYRINKDFFKKQTPEMAYVLGFIYADGSLSITKKYTWGKSAARINISQKDPKILEKIKKLMDCDKKLTKVSRQELYFLDIAQEWIVKDLMKLGLKPAKSLDMKFPNLLEDRYISHFTRGYFDGDGNIQPPPSPRIRWASGSEEFLFGMAEKINQLLGLEMPKIYKHKNTNSYSIGYSGYEKLYKLGNFLYRNANSKMWLTRKKAIWNKTKQFLRERLKERKNKQLKRKLLEKQTSFYFLPN